MSPHISRLLKWLWGCLCSLVTSAGERVLLVSNWATCTIAGDAVDTAYAAAYGTVNKGVDSRF